MSAHEAEPTTLAVSTLRVVRGGGSIDLAAAEGAVTSALRGLLREDARSRAEFLAIAGASR